MDDIPTIIGLVILLALLMAYVASAAWAVGDAQKRGQSGGALIFLLWIFGPLAAIVWLIVRPRDALIDQPPKSYDNADDMISAASRLEMLGEWNTAIVMYQQAASQWPEHERYAQECIGRIKRKQA